MRTARPLLVAAAIGLIALAGSLPVATASPSPPTLGTKAAGSALRDVPGTVRYGAGYAIPLEAQRPAWFTDALRRRVLAADGQPVQAPPDAPLPSEIGIRPGSWMLSPAGCTMNFVFRGGGGFGIGTAGHCGAVGDEVILLTLAPGTENPVLVNIGSIVLRHSNDVGDDFGLVAIRPELNEWVSPTISLIAGPCGQYLGSGPETVAHYGHGLVIGTGGTPRVGLALTWERDAFGWDGLGIFGDSGSPVRVTNLAAAGNFTHLVVDPNFLPSFLAGTRITKILQIAGGWSLVNSSLC